MNMEHTNTSYDEGASNYDSIMNTTKGHTPDRRGEPSARSNDKKDNNNTQALKTIISKRIIVAMMGMVVIAVASSAITATILKQVRL